MSYLQLDNISFGYPEKDILFQDLSATFQNPNKNKGYAIALMGASGSGKSTLLGLMMKTLKPHRGRITSLPAEPVISYVPQEPVLFEHLSPLENARYFSKIASYKKMFDEALFTFLVGALGMEGVLYKAGKVHELSGGEKQRIQLLRALSIKPDILLLDEPTTGLDADIKLQFLNELREIIVSHKVLAIYVTHHKTEAEFIADEVAFLVKKDRQPMGHIFQGPLFEFVTRPPVLEGIKIFNYPHPNILKVGWDGRGKICIPEHIPENADYAVVRPADVGFSIDGQEAFSISSSNGIFSVLEINGQRITVNTCPEIFQPGMKIRFGDDMLIYSPDHTLKQADLSAVK
ncbi:MAG TPA: ABC transporter ATP-binding protein [Puia sp.]|nr:ABC transporter ATP-binding protein [Puia sp.]